MIVGIDLGTTNSLIAVWDQGQARLIPNSLGEVLTPSCVSIDKDGSILIGKAAKERLQTHPAQSASVFKRHMGSNKQIRLGQQQFRPEELSALILRSLKEDAEAALGQPVTEAIITVPAYFSDAQRKATKTAGKLAGLKVDRLLNEPTAAALAYGIHLRDGESKFLVLDLGGGTFDVSVLDLFENVMEVRASAGDNFLGGEDFLHCLQEEFFSTHPKTEKLRNDAQFMQQLVAQAELTKRNLSSMSSSRLVVTHGEEEYALDIDEAKFEKICAPLLLRLRDPAERALRDSNIPIAELNAIVLAGGATRMPIVRKMVARMFGRFPASDINPDEVVALGAAVQAGLMMKDSALSEVVMTDVSPYSLGVETVMALPNGRYSEGFFDPVIERNSVIPISKVKHYFPTHADQRHVLINIFQGEARLTKDNVHLGQLSVDLTGDNIQDNAFDIRFTYDVSGLLQVEVTVLKSGHSKAILIEGNPGLLSEDEIAQRLAALSELKIHPRERMEYRTLLARGERLYQQLRGDEREWLGARVTAFEQLLDKQDISLIARHSGDFKAALDELERHSFTTPVEPIR